MSFAKIAEGRAVRKIVAMIRTEAKQHIDADSDVSEIVLEELADRIERGEWKDIKLPQAKAKKK